jgi:hypothetical protein
MPESPADLDILAAQRFQPREDSSIEEQGHGNGTRPDLVPGFRGAIPEAIEVAVGCGHDPFQFGSGHFSTAGETFFHQIS